MKISRLKFCTLLATGAVLPVSVAIGRAASTPQFLITDGSILDQNDPQPMDWDDAKRRKLRRAYWILEGADHDYRGHRVEAMKEIKKAAEMMGMDLHGDGYGGGRQKWSDERLREARGLVEEVVDKTGRREHEHLRVALREINKALEVK